MVLLLAVLALALFGLGFVNSLWWLFAVALVFAYVHYGRGGAGRPGRDEGPAYREYRDARDREERWSRRYGSRRRGRWLRQDRRDRLHHR
ncbi:hypothetical protein H9Y04_18850 [Streptomyces sp. TRM66268-LWL]|uniref:Integral membrane protein n=1 Tax=Streptomyces polyasparticus TaxID=2767826 RepID=A0ABR7SGK5_9ACTN|nr:hypothetical protein [Streptomyces polyasparticus]